MAARKITPERREQRKKLLALLQDAGINDVAGVEDLFKEMVGTVLENGLVYCIIDIRSNNACNISRFMVK